MDVRTKINSEGQRLALEFQIQIYNQAWYRLKISDNQELFEWCDRQIDLMSEALREGRFEFLKNKNLGFQE